MSDIYVKIFKKLMKHKIATLSTGFALFVIMPIAFLVFNERYFLDNGVSNLLLWGLFIHVLAVMLWWCISFLTTSLMYKNEVSDTETEWDIAITSVPFNIAMGSIIASIFGMITLVLCYMFEWSFKTFCILLYGLILNRIVIAIWDLKKYNNKKR